MSKKQTSGRNARQSGTDDVDGNVDKIRDILFGGQMREFENRLEAMEKNLAQAIERSAKDLERRFDRLDKYARREVEKLNEQIKNERKERAAELKQGEGELNNLANHVETWFTEVDEQLGTESKELRDLLQAQTEELQAQVHESHSELKDTLAKDTAELARTRLARDDLAAVLAEVAERLGHNSKPSKG